MFFIVSFNHSPQNIVLSTLDEIVVSHKIINDSVIRNTVSLGWQQQLRLDWSVLMIKLSSESILAYESAIFITNKWYLGAGNTLRPITAQSNQAFCIRNIHFWEFGQLSNILIKRKKVVSKVASISDKSLRRYSKPAKMQQRIAALPDHVVALGKEPTNGSCLVRDEE